MKKILRAILLFTIAFAVAGCSAIPIKTGSSQTDSAPRLAASNNAESDMMLQAESNSSEDEKAKVEFDTSSAKKADASLTKNVDKELDVAVSNAVIDSNEGAFLEGEVKAEGHIVLSQSTESDGTIVVYAITMYGEYAFQNNVFLKISGTGAIPTVITFVYDKDTGYSLRSFTVPNDGSGYVDSVKEMFPKDLYNNVLSVSDSDISNLEAQERKYAKAYLNKIGRSAEITDYEDVNYIYPKISDDTSKQVFKRYWEYPDWIGTEEKIEDGVRYVYETQWKDYGNNDSMIYFSKYVYSTGEIIKAINIYIDDGVVQSSEEKVTRIIENSSTSNSNSSSKK